MKIDYQPRSGYEKSAQKVYNLLVENFSETYYVGGMVRDLLLNRKIADIDIATAATPDQVTATLRNSAQLPTAYNRFGVIGIPYRSRSIEIATFRRDLPAVSRYPEVQFIADARTDSRRRDFTVNSLYFKPKSGTVWDFQGGLKDIQQRLIRFVGPPEQRITEDPLRIIRAWRFEIELKFSVEAATARAIRKLTPRLEKLSAKRIELEIGKCSSSKNKKILRQKISNPAYLT
jgi:tRNA nucleotidyltransferase/poly(A) polymerase